MFTHKSKLLISLDLDGTTLQENKELSSVNARAIKKLQRKGHMVVFNTGRQYQESLDIAASQNLILPIIYSNGAGICLENGKQIHSLSLSKRQAEKVLALFNNVRLHVCTTDGNWYINEEAFRFIEVEEALLKIEGRYQGLKAKLNRHRTFIENTYKKGSILHSGLLTQGIQVSKIIAYTSNMRKKQQLMQQIQDTMGDNQVAVTSSYPNDIEVTHPQATKGKALLTFANYKGIPHENTIAIGDNWNDYSMLTFANRGYMVANTNEAMKIRLQQEWGKSITLLDKSNDQNAVASILHKLEKQTIFNNPYSLQFRGNPIRNGSNRLL